MGIDLDIKILEQLNEVLIKNEIPETSFGLKGFGEDRLCIEKAEEEWEVYYGCRGQKHHLKVYAEVIEAAIDMISRCSETEEQNTRMIVEFMNAYYDLRRKPSRSNNIQRKNMHAKGFKTPLEKVMVKTAEGKAVLATRKQVEMRKNIKKHKNKMGSA